MSAPAALHEGTAQLAEVEVLLLLERLVVQGEELMEAVAAARRGNWGEAAAGGDGVGELPPEEVMYALAWDPRAASSTHRRQATSRPFSARKKSDLPSG